MVFFLFRGEPRLERFLMFLVGLFALPNDGMEQALEIPDLPQLPANVAPGEESLLILLVPVHLSLRLESPAARRVTRVGDSSLEGIADEGFDLGLSRLVFAQAFAATHLPGRGRRRRGPALPVLRKLLTDALKDSLVLDRLRKRASVALLQDGHDGCAAVFGRGAFHEAKCRRRGRQGKFHVHGCSCSSQCIRHYTCAQGPRARADAAGASRGAVSSLSCPLSLRRTPPSAGRWR